MSNLKNSLPPSPPPVAHYEFIYEDDVRSLAALMAHDEREYWKLMLNVDAVETINQAKLDYIKEHIAALQEEYALLTKAIKALATTGKNWMIDAAKRPADVRGPQRKNFTKIREDHGVATLESNARSKQAAFKDEIKKYKELYRAAKTFLLQKTSNRKKTEDPRQKTSPLGPSSNLETAVHVRRNTGQPETVSDANLQDAYTEGDDVIHTTATAPDLSGQPNVVSDVSLQGSVTGGDELGGSTDAAPDRSDQSYIDADENSQAFFTQKMLLEPITVPDVKLQDPPSSEVGDTKDAAVDQYGQSNEVTVVQLQGTTSRESEAIADRNTQDFLDEHEVRGSAEAAADLYDQFEDQSPDSADQFVKAATNCLADIANLGRADTTGPSPEELEEKLPPDLRKDVFRRRSRNRLWDIRKLEAYLLEVVELFRATYGDKDLPLGADASKAFVQRCSSPTRPRTRPFKTSPTPACKKANNVHSAKLEPVNQDLNEPSSDSEADVNGPVQNVEGTEGFDDDSKDPQTKNVGTYAILSNNKENGTHRTTLLECVKVTVGHPTDKKQQCETVLLLDSASDHTYLKQSLCGKLQLPNLGPTKLSVATFLSSDKIPVDTFVSRLRIRKSNGKTIYLKAPVMPDQFVGRMHTAFIRPEHIMEHRNGSCAVYASTTPEILVGRDLRHLFEVVEEHKPLQSGFLLVHSNVGTMLVGSGKADMPADQSGLSQHRSFFIRTRSDEVTVGQLLEPPLADKDLAPSVVSSFRENMEERASHKVLHVSKHAADQKLANLLHWMPSLEQMGIEPPSPLDEDDSIHQRPHDSIKRYRVNKYKPFSHIGLVDFGCYAVQGTHAMQTVHKKVRVLNVSCLTTRCIWMDVVLDMSTESFTNAFKRHMTQNGSPFSVIRDNATSFVAGGKAPKRVSNRNRPASSAENLRRSLRQTCRVTRLVSDTTMNCDSGLELDYDEDLPTSDQRPVYGQDQRKRFEVNERIILPSDGPIPVLDSHLHADEVEKHALDWQVFPPVYATWSQDQAFRPTRHDQFQFTGYIKVFCRMNTFLLLEKVLRVAGSSYYPMDMCLGACVGVHPGNCEDWHQRNDLKLYLAGCFYNATLGPYRVVGLGECALDYTNKAVVRDENGVVQTIHGRPLQSRDIEALRQHQYPALEKQLNIVVTRLRKVDGGYYPVVLHLRNRDDQETDVHADAIGIMRRVGMPKDYPIYCHYWTGGRTQYDNWTSHFPNTLFGFNAGSFSRGLSPDQLNLLRTIPLDQVTFESDAPYHGKRGTSQTIGTPAGVVRAITQFKELGSRPESLETIAQASMANVIRMFRPDLTVIIEKAGEDDTRERQTSPSDQTNRIGPNTTTMFELTSICDAGATDLIGSAQTCSSPRVRTTKASSCPSDGLGP